MSDPLPVPTTCKVCGKLPIVAVQVGYKGGVFVGGLLCEEHAPKS